MPKLSPVRQSVPVLPGLQLLGRGKVRDSYALDEKYMLVVATDSISIFDIVLNAFVPEKGMVLTAMTHYWLTRLENELQIKVHLAAAGADIDPYLPPELRGNPGLQSRALVVHRLKMTDKEFIARGFITGSGLKDYKATGEVCGIKLPIGLQDGDLLCEAIATPTTKAQEGHDLALDAKAIREQYPEETELLLDVYGYVFDAAREKGILFADTKLEFGRDESDHVVLADEVATPDSSRYWERSIWEETRKLVERKAPPPYDKQLVRQWGIEQGISKLDPLSPEDVARAHALEVPDELIRATTQTYRYIFSRLTGMRLETYQRTKLGIAVEEKKRRLAVVLGSESDIPDVQNVLRSLSTGDLSSEFASKAVHVISCHRNPRELDGFAASRCGGADVVIAAGGKAFALPGVLDALLHSKGINIPVIGVALGTTGSTSLEAATLSISELPGQPVVMDEVRGQVYEGCMGLAAAIRRAATGEFPVPKKRAVKPAQFHIDLSAFT